MSGVIGGRNMEREPVDHFGRLHEPIRLVPENAWVKAYNWRSSGDSTEHYFLNKLTNERVPIDRNSNGAMTTITQ